MEAGSGWHGVELRHFAALEAVAREKSFSVAAVSLGYTQSAISGQITALERIVGARLFTRIRGSKGVELTEAGEVLLEHAASITARVHAARADLYVLQNGEAGVLRVGTFQSASQTLLPQILRTVAVGPDALNPALYEDALIEKLVLMLERGELDVAFVLLPLAASEVESVALLEDPWTLLVRRDHPLAGETVLAPRDLSGVPLISLGRLLPPAAPSKAPQSIYLVEEAISAAGVVPDVRLRLNDYRSIHVLVEAGMGCGLVPSLALSPSEHGELVAVPIELPPRVVGLAWHRERRRTRAFSRFVEAAVEVTQRPAYDSASTSVAGGSPARSA